jgi:O-antigen/teichoic acid export membrane protein
MFGGFADQAIVSLGNFALNITLARSFAEHEYGVFSLILSFALFLNTLHQAFVAYPLSVQGARAEGAHLKNLLAGAGMLTFLEALLFLPVIAGAAVSVHRISLLPLACMFLLSWQLQEVYRRGLLARARFGAAMGSDLVRYIATFAAVLVIGRFAPLSLQSVFLVLVAGSLFASWPLFSAMIAGFSVALANIKREFRDHWRLAAPVLGANMLAALSTQWFLWLLAWGRDLSSSATLVALANVVAFSSPIMFGIENILVPEIARHRDNMTFERLASLLSKRAFVCFALVAPFFGVLILWPDKALHLFYGHHKTYAEYAFALRLLALAYATYLASYIFSAALRGYGATAAVFKMQLYPALFSVTFGTWLTLEYGVNGACFAALVAGVLRVAIGYYFVNALRELTVQNRDVIVAS